MSYQGPERRRHRVLVTNHTEYHMRGETCVAVRDLTTGEWVRDHSAVGSRLESALGGQAWRAAHSGVGVGDKLYFSADVLTSPVRAVDRPAREVVPLYDCKSAA